MCPAGLVIREKRSRRRICRYAKLAREKRVDELEQALERDLVRLKSGARDSRTVTVSYAASRPGEVRAADRVLVPGVGHSVNGSTRWLRVGFINLQVSEPARLCLLLYLAGYLVRRNRSLHEGFTGFLRPMLLLSLACALLLAEPDFGAAIVLLATALGIGGFYLIPRKRRQAKKQFSERIGELRRHLHESLERQTHQEISASADRINETIAPYRRFVETQRARLNESRATVVATGDALRRLRTAAEPDPLTPHTPPRTGGFRSAVRRPGSAPATTPSAASRSRPRAAATAGRTDAPTAGPPARGRSTWTPSPNRCAAGPAIGRCSTPHCSTAGTTRPPIRAPSGRRSAMRTPSATASRHKPATRPDLRLKVLQAADGRRAIELLRGDDPIDLLFTDVILPGGLTGRQLAREARTLRPGMRVLFTSGYTRDSIVHQGKLDVGVHLIAKPYRREDLAAKLREVLRG